MKKKRGVHRLRGLHKQANTWFNRWCREGLITYNRVKYWPMIEAWKAGYRAGKKKP